MPPKGPRPATRLATASRPALRPVFRPIRRTDLARLRRWLNAGEALRWYGKGKPVTAAEVAAKYLPKIRAEVPTHGFLVLAGRTPIGYAQTYRLRDWPDHARAVGFYGDAAGGDAAGLDLFIGEAAFLHRGLGAQILARFLEEVVWPTTGCRSCVADPHPNNRAAIRAFEKAGFARVGAVGAAHDAGAGILMRIDAPPARPPRQRQRRSK